MKISYGKMIKSSALALAIASIAACGGSDNDTAQSSAEQPANQQVVLQGKAATGAALQGSVVAVNAKGEVSEPATVAADGSYSVKVNKAEPYMLKGMSTNLKGADGKALELFSYAAKAGNVNVTTLTTQALYGASNKANLATVFKNWQANQSSISQTAIDEAAKRLLVNLQAQLSAAGVTNNPNIFTTDFQTNGTGIDKVMDNVQVSYNCGSPNSCEATYVVDGKPYTWQYDANVSTITFDAAQVTDGEVKGDSTLTITGTVSVTSPVALTTEIPNVVLKNIPKPQNESEFCSGDYSQYTVQGFSLSGCSFNGNVGKISGAVNITQQGVTVKQTYSYTYTYS